MSWEETKERKEILDSKLMRVMERIAESLEYSNNTFDKIDERLAEIDQTLNAIGEEISNIKEIISE